MAQDKNSVNQQVTHTEEKTLGSVGFRFQREDWNTGIFDKYDKNKTGIKDTGY